MANYHQVKNAAILTPTTNQDLGSDANRYSNVFMSGNIVMSNGVTVTSTNVITPKIASVTYPGNDTAADTAGGQTITITGTGFSSGATVLIGGSPVAVVTVVSSTSITFTSPSSSAGNYALYVVNSDGGTAIYIPGIAYSGTPTWSTSSGSLATVYETNSISNTVTATGDATISYSVASGTLPTGSSLNTSSGLISGTAPASAGSTTYTFTIRATDGQNQDTDRSFSITVNTDSVSWSSPADNTSTALDVGSAMSTVTLSATSAAGKSITYSANALPTGVSISTNTIVGTPTVVGNTTSLITATAASSGRTATRTLSWVVSVASEPYWMYTTLLLNGEGAAASNNATNNTFIDSSANNYTITNTNTPTQGTNSPYSQVSWSNYFGTINESLTLSMGAGQAFGTSDFTVECWLNPLNTAINIFTPVTATSSWGMITYANQLYWQENGGNLSGAGYGSISLNQWTHIAISRSSSVLKMFINGVQVYSAANTFNYSNSSTARNIGPNGGGNAPCYISNLRVVKGTGLYTANFTPSTTPLTAITNTTLLTCQSNRFKDNSTTNATLTINGNVVVQKFSPFNGTTSYTPSIHGGSVYLKGANAVTGDYLTTTMAALGTGDFTIECWTYLESTGFINGGAVWAIYNSGGTMQLLLRPENNVYWRVSLTGAGQEINQASSPVVTNRWTHHAVVRISGTTKYYQDGILIGSAVNSFDYGGVLQVGSYANYNMKGFISDFRVVAGTGVYTGSFTPPTQALTAISGTRVLLSFTNAGVIDQTGMNDLRTFGNAKISTAEKKYNSGSISLTNGSGDYCLVPYNPIYTFGTGDFTIEAWVYRTDTGVQRAIVDNSAGQSNRILFYITTNNKLNMFDGSSTWLSSTNTVTANQWVHVAVARSSGTTRLFINGTQEASSSDSRNYIQGAVGLHIGRQNEATVNDFMGYMDDLRITNGYARYTATFTPPTTSLNLK